MLTATSLLSQPSGLRRLGMMASQMNQFAVYASMQVLLEGKVL
jgi:hypothetical protein